VLRAARIKCECLSPKFTDEAAFMFDAGECYAAPYASSSYVQIIAEGSAGNPGSWFALQCDPTL